MMTTATALVLALVAGALAQGQQDHQQHHPGATAPPAQPAPPPAASPQPGQMPMGQMPHGQMPMGHMPMMQQRMQGHMGIPGHMGQMPHAAAMTPATKAYVDAADRMHGPMMQGLQAGDPDVAFVRGMIAHHVGAIEMARVRIQYGKDEQTKRWAEAIIREQQHEIDEMLGWLAKNAR
jgi:uncharacterized protein (DUF305 family)